MGNDMANKGQTQPPPRQAKRAEAKDRPQTIIAPFGAPKEGQDGGVKKSLVQSVYEVLMQGMDEGIFLPGQRVKAAELAKRLGLSRAPVREALHVLAGQGLVEMHPDKGAVLRVLSIKDLIQLYETLGAVSTLGVVAATQKINEGNNAEIVRAAMENIYEAGRQPPSYRFYLALNDLHYSLNEMGDRPYVTHISRILNIEYWNRFLAANIDLNRHMPKYVDNYRRLTDQVLAGDVHAAAGVMQSHFEWSISLLQNPQKNTES
jgi:DNA-binding GntR family transcriptional regulator